MNLELSDDEYIIYEAKISNVSLISYIVTIVVFIIAIFVVQNLWFSILSIAIIFLSIIDLFKCIVAITTTKLYITSKRVIGKTGLINTKTLESPLNKITSSSTSKKLLGHIFNYGNISINVFSDKYEYNFVKDPETLKNKLMKFI